MNIILITVSLPGIKEFILNFFFLLRKNFNDSLFKGFGADLEKRYEHNRQLFATSFIGYHLDRVA